MSVRQFTRHVSSAQQHVASSYHIRLHRNRTFLSFCGRFCWTAPVLLRDFPNVKLEAKDGNLDRLSSHPVFTPLPCLGYISLILKIGFFYESNFFLTEGNWNDSWRIILGRVKMFINSFSPEVGFQLYKKWSAASLMATLFLFGTNPPGSCNFTLPEEKMPMSKTSLDHIIVSLPKRHKENRKIVNVRTEVAGGLSELCYVKEILYQLGQR